MPEGHTIHNAARDHKKLFVGHAGSLFLGFWIAYFLVLLINAPNYIGLNDQSQQILSFVPYNFFAIRAENIPVLVVAVINLPVLDTLRVMLLRVLKGKSPFAADKNHIHHIFIDKGFTHLKTSLLLCMINFLNLAIVFLFEPLFNSVELTIVYIFINLFWISIFEVIKRN